ncbi:13846_t:CDS:10 [Funneliformis geosporum]|uniref:13846_t:CDS:1 n=1 Tax=Funneliformis geosporum TaxID=1117311 RepID=A0A9W4SCF8_9GLOM|nr:13846_t:CDS:10 [Funneliformis geosporum]
MRSIGMWEMLIEILVRLGGGAVLVTKLVIMATGVTTKENFITSKVNLDNRYLNTAFRQSTDRSQERYKEVMQDTLPLKEEKIVLIPTRLRELLANTSDEITVKLGCFPYTNLVYFTVNDNLFIWEYEKGNDDNAIGHIDVHPLQDLYIKCVGLAKPRPGRFIDDAQYVLVIVTDKSIYIFGLSNTPTGIVFHDMSSDRYRANYSKKTVESIVGTEDGRIFLIDAGELCELVYEDEGWFSHPCRLEIQSLSTFNQHWRFISNYSSRLRSAVIDDTRRMLYVMSESHIEAFNITKDGGPLKHLGRWSINEDRSSLRGTLASMHPIYVTESAFYCLVAVTSTGQRGYFTCYYINRGYNVVTDTQNFKNKEPNSLTLYEVHEPPPQPPAQVAQQSITGFSMFKYFHGVFFALRREGGSHVVTTTNPNHGSMFLRISQNQELIFSEHLFIFPYHNIYEIQEIINPLYDPKVFEEFSNDLINQFCAPSRKFLVYSHHGIIILNKLRPVDHLENILKKGSSRESSKAFIDNYGEEQTSAMCFLIANDESYSFLKIFNYKTLFEGFGYCLARILRPVWKQRILKLRPNATNANRLDTSIPEPKLQYIVKKLLNLKKFCDKHPDLKTLHHLESGPLTAPPQAIGISGLYDALVRMTDAISFILLMLEYSLPETIEGVDLSTKQTIANSNFDQLVTDMSVRSSWHDVVLAIIKRETTPRVNVQCDFITFFALPVENLSRNLEARCPTFCNAVEGYEALQKAKKNEDEHTTIEALRISLKLFTDSINTMTYGTLINLCNEYKNFEFYEGAVELLLKAAHTMEHVTEKRKSILDNVIETLRDAGVFNEGVYRHTQTFNPVLHKALELGLSLKDIDFLFAVYDEFLRADSVPQLFDPAAPYIEDYLTHSKDLSSPEVRKKLDLYCDYCVKRHEYLKAAEVKDYIAQNSGGDVTLQERLHYLSHAVGQAESAKEFSENAKVIEALNKYRLKMKIAQIQFEIYTDINGMPENVYNNFATSQGIPSRDEVLALLNQKLYDSHILLNDFIHPFDLYEKKLALLQIVEEAPYQTEIVNVWENIIQKGIYHLFPSIQKSDQTNSIQPIADVLIKAGRKYYPSDTRMMPLDKIIIAVSKYFIENEITDPGIITKILRQAKINYAVLFETFKHVLNNRSNETLYTKGGMRFLFRELCFILDEWIKTSGEVYDIDTNGILNLIDRWIMVIDSSKLGQDLREVFMENRRNIEALKRRKNE